MGNWRRLCRPSDSWSGPGSLRTAPQGQGQVRNWPWEPWGMLERVCGGSEGMGRWEAWLRRSYCDFEDFKHDLVCLLHLGSSCCRYLTLWVYWCILNSQLL